MISKKQALIQEFKEALMRFKEALQQAKTDFMRDSAIKRFELSFDLSWKTIKAFLEERGIWCNSPLGCFKEAFREGLLDYDEIWLDMVKTRNLTVHTYKEELAEEVYEKLPQALSAFQKLVTKLEL